MTPVTDPALLAQLNGGSGSPVSDPALLAQLNGDSDQPSFMDRVIASPLGRLAHNIAAPVGNLISHDVNFLAGQVGQNAPIRGVANAVNSAGDAIEGGYQAALARNRNTPGYAAERTQADKLTQASGVNGSGLSDQLFSGLNPVLRGAVSLTGGLDASNAAADSQQDAQAAYAAQHPALSSAANIVGGTALGMPEKSPVTLPAAPVKPMVQQAANAGYVLPPRMVSDNPGMMARSLEGWSGKVKTAQAASEANQQVTNNLAKQSIGIPASEDITQAGIDKIRSQAGQVRKNIQQQVPDIHTDPQFAQEVAGLSGNSSLAQTFPSIAKNDDIEALVTDFKNAPTFSTQNAFDAIRRLRQKASANYKAFNDADKLELAAAQKSAADSMEDLIERNLLRNGYTGIQEYQNARQLLAKTYDVEGATNLATGNVNASKIAAMANKGRPLSGELKIIADTHSAFPAAMQPLDRIGGVEPLSTLDLGAAALSATHGNPGIAGALLGKPVARAAVLSKPMQRSMMGAVPLQLPRLGAPNLGLLAGSISGLPKLQQQPQ